MTETLPPPGAYPALADACETLLEEKRSTFTALLRPIDTREQALTALEQIRRERPGASHYCWAYILGSARQPRSQAFNDDGEPSGTAGKPILHVLTQRGAGDCLAVVVRTFGGIKLGAGGLVRAYGAAVSQALDRAQWRQITPASDLVIGVDFALEERIRHCLAQHELPVTSADYSRQVQIGTRVPQPLLESLRAEVQQLTSGQFDWRTD